jgi:hypothetical protein
MNYTANNFKNFKHHDDKTSLMKLQKLKTINVKKKKKSLDRSNKQLKEGPSIVGNMAIGPKIVTRILKR